MAHASSNIRRDDTGGDEDDYERSQQNQENMTSEDIAPISRAFSSYQASFVPVSAIKLHKLQFGLDNHVIIADEKSRVLNYCTPHFRAIAWIEVPPLPAGANIELGWIQVITDRQCTSTYGKFGLTSWELPELMIGKFNMVSDADGSCYPWHGIERESALGEGPTDEPLFTDLYMSDYFNEDVPWEIPFEGYTEDPCLTFVYRKERFYVYLALRDVNTDTYQIIRTLTWSMELAIDVNPKYPLRKRGKLLGPYKQENPKVVPQHLAPPLESYALKSPNSERCEALVWRSKDGDPQFVNYPDHSTLIHNDLTRYLIRTRSATSELLRMNKSEFLLQQQQKQQETEEDGGEVDEICVRKNGENKWWKERWEI